MPVGVVPSRTTPRRSRGLKTDRIGFSQSAGSADTFTIKRREGETLVVFCFRIKVAARRRIDLPLPFLLRFVYSTTPNRTS